MNNVEIIAKMSDMRDRENRKGQIWVSFLSGIVNSFSVDIKGLSELIQQDKNFKALFRDLAVAWIRVLKGMSDTPTSYDGRNEIACKNGAIIFDYALTGLGRLPHRYECSLQEWVWRTLHIRVTDFALSDQIAWGFSGEHRTLQQTFSKWMFYYYKTYVASPEIDKQLTEVFGYEDWWKLPMI